MFSKASLLLLLATILMMSTSSHGAFCTYYRNSNSIMCGSVTCSTASPTNEADKLPPGYYYIGNYYTHPRHGVPWFNLYRQRNGGGFWDYHTEIPELGCRGGFGLHSGSFSLGCVTVTESCFSQLRNEINRHYSEINFNAYECRGCHERWRWIGSGYSCYWTKTISRVRTGDLQSV